MAKKKVLLMGKAHSGKTSMRSIIFANYLARDTMRLSTTLDVEHHHVRFLGDLVLNLWDCGGQDAFYESYFERDRETIFRSVELLIYVFDIASDCPEKDFEHFAGVLEAIDENSPDARIFVLVHKMDLVAKEEQEMILEDRRRLIEERCTAFGVHNFKCFGTSIWDETLYKAWSEIVTNLIPNIGVLESHLDDFCRICDADEVVLFERATFLVISHSRGKKITEGDDDDDQPPDDIKNDANKDLDASGHATPAAVDATEAQTPNDMDAGMNSNSPSNSNLIAVEGTAPTLTPTSSTVNDSIGALANSPATMTQQQPQTTLQALPPTLDDDVASAASSLIEGAVPSSIDGNFNDSSQILPSVFSEVTGNDSSPYPYQQKIGGGPSPTSNVGNRLPNSSHLHNQNRSQPHHQQQQQPPPQQPPPTNKRKQKQRRQRQQSLLLDTHRFEKISNIVKQFKLSCEKAQSQFQGMEVSNSRFTACIDAFTANTYIMVIVSRDSGATAAGGGGRPGGGFYGGGMAAAGAATLLNIQNARSHFERFIPMS